MYSWRDKREATKKFGVFGVPYLDDKLKGIGRSDLILIGARTGAGKSTIAQQIAKENAIIGRKVSLFSLENSEGDAEDTIAYYAYINKTREYDKDFRSWQLGVMQYDSEAVLYAEKVANEYFADIKLTSRRKNFDVTTLVECMVRDAEGGAEIIVLDHLDYVDKDNMSENDISHMTELMRGIREIQDVYNIAIVAISHLRKQSDSRFTPIVPSIDEFIGSSNKVKEATTVILIAPDDEENMLNASSGNNFIKKTWCCIRKLRGGGIDNKVAKLDFDIRTGNYLKEYEMFAVDYSGKKTIKVINGTNE